MQMMQVCLDYIPNPEEATGTSRGATGSWEGTVSWASVVRCSAYERCELKRNHRDLGVHQPIRRPIWDDLRAVKDWIPNKTCLVYWDLLSLYWLSKFFHHHAIALYMAFVFYKYSFSPKFLTSVKFYQTACLMVSPCVAMCRHCAHFGSRGAWRSGAFTKRSVPTSRWLLSVLSGSMSGFIGISRGDMGTGNRWPRKLAVAPLAQAFSLAAGHLRLGNPSCQCRPA